RSVTGTPAVLSSWKKATNMAQACAVARSGQGRNARPGGGPQNMSADQQTRRNRAMRTAKRLGLAIACLLLASFPAANRPIRLIVGFIPGSAADITARVLGQRHEPKSRSAIRYRSQTGRWIKSRSPNLS